MCTLDAVSVDYAPEIQRAARWGAFFAETWASEVPTRIHTSRIGADGTPDWAADFSRFLTLEEGRNGERDEERQRTSRVMRRLRRASIREYEVLYRVLMERESVEQVTGWLNERAAANAIPLPRGRDVHYRAKDTIAIILAATAYCLHHW